MSLARKHREFILAQSEPAVAPKASGHTADTLLVSERPSLARSHRDRALAAAAATAAAITVPEADTGTPEERAAAQVRLRLQHDLRRLKDIQSIEAKIAAKREMLPNYRDWVLGLIDAAEASGEATADDILPTIMVWLIDVGEYAGALGLAKHVIRFDVPMPARYERTAPALVVEEIATAALKAQGLGQSFPLAILDDVATLTASIDMHDQISAKLFKAIGIEQMRAADDDAAEPLARATAAALALETLRRAKAKNERVGVSDKIKRLEKLLISKEPPAQTG
ncbi:phage terminase small subunit [Sphingomonas sp. LT1P40]|uniref:phage terminase small subunit n=1 Tax=Alteristakelama amylovorans TaxID=3096166 RepID=UPI002FC81C75